MKIISFIIFSTVVLLGFSFVNAQPVNEISAKPGAFSMKFEKPTAILQTNGQDTVHPSPAKDAAGVDNKCFIKGQFKTRGIWLGQSRAGDRFI